MSSFPIPDHFEIRYGRWALIGDPKTGWWSQRGTWTLELKSDPAERTLEAAAAGLQQEAKRIRATGDEDFEQLLVTIDWLLEQGWPWPEEKGDRARGKLPEFRSGKFQWVKNPADEKWVLFFEDSALVEVTVAEVYRAKSPQAVEDMVVERLNKCLLHPDIRQAMNREMCAAVEAFRSESYPGPLNPYLGRCSRCDGVGWVPDFGQEYVAIRCSRCNGTGQGPEEGS